MWRPTANNRDFLQRVSRFGTTAAPLVRPAPDPQCPRGAYLLGAHPHHRAELYRRRLALLADRIPDALRRTRRADPAEFEEEAGAVVVAGELELGGGLANLSVHSFKDRLAILECQSSLPSRRFLLR